MNDGCGTWIQGHGRQPTRCGEGGICVTCWRKRNDQDVDTLRAQRDTLVAAIEKHRDDSYPNPDWTPDEDLTSEGHFNRALYAALSGIK